MSCNISLYPRLYLQEATMRVMVGANPGKTQHLLDRSAVARTNKRGIMCGKEREVYSGEREQAMALLMACRHLPTQLLASPGERSGKDEDDDDDYKDDNMIMLYYDAGMLTQAARMLDKVGDKRRLEECNTIMKTISSNCTA